MIISMPYRLPSGLFLQCNNPCHWELFKKTEGRFIKLGWSNSFEGAIRDLSDKDKEAAERRFLCVSG